MSKKTKDFLPIGSIVLLKGGKKRIMICGRVLQDNASHKTYDYCGCPYPEGVIDSDEMMLFDEGIIDKVYFIGMQDEEEFAFRKLIIKSLK